MKAFIIKTKRDLYTKYGQGLPSGDSYERWFTSDVEKAHHYKTSGRAKATVTMNKNQKTSSLERYQEKIDSGTYDERRVDRFKEYIKDHKETLEFYNSLEIVEVDIPAPNYIKPPIEVKFASWGIGVLTKKSQGNMYCKGCGVYFKKIPMVQFGTSDRPARICPCCIIENVGKAEKLLEEMGEESRTELEAERFSKRLG